MEEIKQENRLLYSTMLVFFISGFCTQVIGNFVPFLRETYGFDYNFTGLLISLSSMGGLIAVVLAGVLPLYCGRRLSILFWSFWIALGYLILTLPIASPLFLMVAFFGVGLSRGGHSNFTSTMISTLPPPRIPSGFLLIHGSFATGALLSPLVLVLFVRQGLSWKTMALSLCILAVFRLLFYVKMDIPPLPASGKKGMASVDYGFMKDRHFWLGAVILLFYVSVEYGIVGWLVTYFQDTGILSSDMAQLTNSLFWALVLVGRIVGNFIAKKLSPCPILLIDAIGMTGFFFLMFFATEALWVIVGLIGVSFFMATMYPTAYSFGSTNISGNDFACGMLNFLPASGGIIAPALVGFVAEQGGIQQGMGLLVVLTVILLAVILVTAWTMRPKRCTI
ncbi:MFS transporter [Bengtsoniella intestinalis]|uniref:MFS transporter n=1 Tax=Bengtsoniella intestinalis TaxID=3073143 RepID=UPI00391F410C